MPRVNTDEILREFGDWRNMTAGKIAVKKIARYISKMPDPFTVPALFDKSWNIETEGD